MSEILKAFIQHKSVIRLGRPSKYLNGVSQRNDQKLDPLKLHQLVADASFYIANCGKALLLLGRVAAAALG